MNATENTRIEMLRRYLQEDPEDSFIRYALAMELANINKLGESEDLFKELLIKDPEYIATYYQYGKLMEMMQNFDFAMEIYKAGIHIAEKQNNPHTVKELKAALYSLTEDEDETE